MMGPRATRELDYAKAEEDRLRQELIDAATDLRDWLNKALAAEERQRDSLLLTCASLTDGLRREAELYQQKRRVHVAVQHALEAMSIDQQALAAADPAHSAGPTEAPG